MFKDSKKNLLKNLLLKKGKKWKAECLIKKTFKSMQKTISKKQVMPILKLAISSNSVCFAENQQTLKRGKRKRIVKTTVFLVSDKSRFAHSWKNMLNMPSSKKKKPFCEELVEKVISVGSSVQEKQSKAMSVQKKYGLKFKW